MRFPGFSEIIKTPCGDKLAFLKLMHSSYEEDRVNKRIKVSNPTFNSILAQVTLMCDQMLMLFF